MKRKKNNVLKSQSGLSLVEVVASIVILMMIVLSFFGLLIQSNKTGNSSEQIIDATFLAQREMEKMYDYFSTTTQSNWQSSFPYTKDTVNSSGTTSIFGPETLANTKNNEMIKVTVQELVSDNLVKVKIEIFDSKAKILKAKVENIYRLKK